MSRKCLIIIISLFSSHSLFAQSDKQVTGQLYHTDHKRVVTPTFLWQVTGKGIKEPVYLLGTCHAVGLSWLEQQPGISGIIDNSTVLITELFSPVVSAENGSNAAKAIRAVDLLNKEQYLILDSFFRATAGETEGLENEDARNASVVDLAGGIFEMLLRKNASGTYEQMDLQLYQSFENKKKKTLALEDAATLDFNVQDTVSAKRVLDQCVTAVKNKNEFDLDNSASALAMLVAWYKKAEFNYDFDKSQPLHVMQQRSALSVAARNKNWIPKLEAHLNASSVLVAVGIMHLFYKTGLITLLRKDGYRVEPVSLTRQTSE